MHNTGYIEIPLNPIAWKRARRLGNRYFDCQTDDKLAVALHARSLCPNLLPPLEPLTLYLELHMEVPASWGRKKRSENLGKPHRQAPDLDNLTKFLLDALNGVIWPDDKQIAEIHARKIWSEEGKIRLMAMTSTSQDLFPSLEELP